jgi:hypothetical protein
MVALEGTDVVLRLVVDHFAVRIHGDSTRLRAHAPDDALGSGTA